MIQRSIIGLLVQGGVIKTELLLSCRVWCRTAHFFFATLYRKRWISSLAKEIVREVIKVSFHRSNCCVASLLFRTTCHCWGPLVCFALQNIGFITAFLPSPPLSSLLSSLLLFSPLLSSLFSSPLLSSLLLSSLLLSTPLFSPLLSSLLLSTPLLSSPLHSSPLFSSLLLSSPLFSSPLLNVWWTKHCLLSLFRQLSTSDIMLTGDEETDADIAAFIRARENIRRQGSLK